MSSIDKLNLIPAGTSYQQVKSGKSSTGDLTGQIKDGFTRTENTSSPEISMKNAVENLRKQEQADPFKDARDVHEKLKTLKGPAREAFIKEFREKNAGKIFAAVHWHDHQPVYRPGVHPTDTPEYMQVVMAGGDADNRRIVYKDGEAFPIDEMKHKKEFPSFGTQVSFSGSLMENMDKTAEKGMWPGKNWGDHYKNLRNETDTGLGNERLDFVNFGYHHPLMGLIATGQDDKGINLDKDILLQIQMHQLAVLEHFGGPISKGFFPPEMAFSKRMIPALNKAGIKWTEVDNIHFDRANADYNNPADGLAPPNKGDKRNPGTHSYETLPNDLAKKHLVSPDALRPHYTKHIDPATGNEELMVVVPEERSLSSYIQKDRDGGKIQEIINKFDQYNTDPNHPLLVLLASDGDNNGSNSGEFHRNVPIDIATRYPGKVVLTTIEDYLEIYPPEAPKLVSDTDGVKKYEGGDVIHVEDGSWWGANLGDPQFSKWIDPPQYATTYYSPKNNSWASIMAAKNAVLTADSLQPAGNTQESIKNITTGNGNDTEKAWHNLTISETSCYEYWGPDNQLSYSSVDAANKALEHAKKVIDAHGGEDKIGPTVFQPMHYPYNPKGNVNLLSYVYDINDVKSVKVKYRYDDSGSVDTPKDSMFEGPGVKPFSEEISMEKKPFPELENKPPVFVPSKARADIYQVNFEPTIPEGKEGTLIQYYVEAEDGKGNVTKSPVQHVYVGSPTSSNPADVTNEELHNQLKSGDPATMANALAFVFTTGRNDVNVFNHAFFRIENGDNKLMTNLENLAIKQKIKLSEEPKFRDEYINRLDKHLVKEENVAKLKAQPHLSYYMSHPLANQASDPRVARILAKLS